MGAEQTKVDQEWVAEVRGIPCGSVRRGMLAVEVLDQCWVWLEITAVETNGQI